MTIISPFYKNYHILIIFVNRCVVFRPITSPIKSFADHKNLVFWVGRIFVFNSEIDHCNWPQIAQSYDAVVPIKMALLGQKERKYDFRLSSIARTGYHNEKSDVRSNTVARMVDKTTLVILHELSNGQCFFNIIWCSQINDAF